MGTTSKADVIRARCSADLKRRVVALADRIGLEEADIIRLAVTDYLNRHEGGSGNQTTLTLHDADRPTRRTHRRPQ
jgi:tetrahydromethanopterin S-methyltransferase subunit A